MRVAIVLPPREAFSPDAAGAVASVAYLHARHSASAATVLGPPTAHPFADVAFSPVVPRLWPGSPALRYAAGVAAALRQLRPDLIDVHNRPDVALFLSRRFGRVSLVLHNDPRGMAAARTAAQRTHLRTRLARVFPVSSWVAERFGPGPGVVVLPNAIDPRTLPPPSRRGRNILFVGRVVADKGADLFVAACARALPALPGWTAALLGADRFGADTPDTPFLRTLRPRAHAAGIAMPGWQPRAQVLAAMAEAAMVVMPGRWPEPFGLVALEAMALGTPLIYAPGGGLPELVGEAGLPVPPDALTLAAALTNLAGSPARRAALGAAGQARAAAFAAPRIAAALDAERSAVLATWPSRPNDTI